MRDNMSPFSAEADPELGEALRSALAPNFPEAFVGRVMTRLAQRQAPSWDEELAHWFWRGLVAASVAVVLAGWGWTRVSPVTESSDASVSVASELLDGSRPVVEIVIASMSSSTP